MNSRRSPPHLFAAEVSKPCGSGPTVKREALLLLLFSNRHGYRLLNNRSAVGGCLDLPWDQLAEEPPRATHDVPKLTNAAKYFAADLDRIIRLAPK
jgi:hypothetical protein